MNELVIRDRLLQDIKNEIAVFGILGNLFAVSGLDPKKLDDNFKQSLGMTNSEYTDSVDLGTYESFEDDNAPYGLAQWSTPSKKEALFAMKKSTGLSIGDINLQLDYLVSDLKANYAEALLKLESASNLIDASNTVLTEIEAPNKEHSDEEKTERSNYCLELYHKYSTTATSIAAGTSRIPELDEDKRVRLELNKVSYNDPTKLDEFLVTPINGHVIKYKLPTYVPEFGYAYIGKPTVYIDQEAANERGNI